MVIDRDVDLKSAAEMIVAGASFDNGIICSHEQFVLTAQERFEETVEAFRATGKVWYTADRDQVQKLRDVVFHGGHLNKEVVGRPAPEIAAKAGIDIPKSVRVILVLADGSGTEDILAKEKLCPVVAIFPYKTFEDAVACAKANLLVEGAGHSAALHSNSEEHIRQMGVALPVSRLVVNQASARFVDQWVCAHDDARLRILGRQLDLGESRLQAPDEHLADRQTDHEENGSDG